MKFEDKFQNRLSCNNDICKAKSGTYILTHVSSGYFYIGSSIDIAKRQNSHIYKLRHHVHHCKEMQKLYNQDPNFIFTYTSYDYSNSENIKQLLLAEEQKLIDLHYRNPLLLNKGMNATFPFKGLKHSFETKEKMSLAAIGHPVSEKQLAALMELNKNRVFSIETRNKMSLSHSTEKAKKRRHDISSSRMKPVSINGIIYESTREAARRLKISQGCIQWRVSSNSDIFSNWFYVEKGNETVFTTGMKSLEPNTLNKRVDTIFIPLKEVFNVARSHVWSISPNLQIDWFEYVTYVLRYIFEEDSQINPALQTTECRTMLLKHGFTQEQMAWIEHFVIMMAIELVGESHAFIKVLSKQNLINGFHWDINRHYDLIITLSYR